MGHRWDGQPPEDAYERHSRDLAVVTAEFASFLDDLPARLTAMYDCTVRDATAEETSRLAHGGHGRYDEDLVAALRGALAVTVGGFEEFSRLTDGVHEVGWSAEGRGSRASLTPTSRPVDEWRQSWAPWTRR